MSQAPVILNGPMIEAGEAVSTVLDVSAGAMVIILTPEEWTSANLTFQVSVDGEQFFDLYDVRGDEITIEVVAGTAVHVPTEWASVPGFIRVRSGPAADPVEQEDSRTFAIVIAPKETLAEVIEAAAREADDGPRRA